MEDILGAEKDDNGSAGIREDVVGNATRLFAVILSSLSLS
jgi:hypothetical protein